MKPLRLKQRESVDSFIVQEARETRLNVTVRPTTRVYLVQLTGSYGPYAVRGTNFIIREENCV
jgi:hypothetical protein